jgi:hypothetical protein
MSEREHEWTKHHLGSWKLCRHCGVNKKLATRLNWTCGPVDMHPSLATMTRVERLEHELSEAKALGESYRVQRDQYAGICRQAAERFSAMEEKKWRLPPSS